MLLPIPGVALLGRNKPRLSWKWGERRWDLGESLWRGEVPPVGPSLLSEEKSLTLGHHRGTAKHSCNCVRFSES